MMDVLLTTNVLEKALLLYPKPEIFNTDQESQYAAKAHVDILIKNNTKKEQLSYIVNKVSANALTFIIYIIMKPSSTKAPR